MSFFNKIQGIIQEADQFLKLNGAENFPLKAADLLEQNQLHLEFDLKEVLTQALSQHFHVPQKYPHFEFSDFPLTLAQGEHCFLDMYCWHRRPTSIHHHHFRGAFQCVQGENFDWTYEYHEMKKLSTYHSLGELYLKEKRILRPGDVSPIRWQEDFIHQNLHRSDLTVNLCLRTHDVPDTYLADYLSTGLKILKHSIIIERVERFYQSIFLMVTDEVNLTLDENILFLAKTFNSASQSVSLVNTREKLHSQLFDQTGISIDDLFLGHQKYLEELEIL